jgi:hypothetical protein
MMFIVHRRPSADKNSTQRHTVGYFCLQQTSCSVRAEGVDWNGTRHMIGTVCTGMVHGLWFELFVWEWDTACDLSCLYGNGTRPVIWAVCMGMGHGLWFELFVWEWDTACDLNCLYGNGTRPVIWTVCITTLLKNKFLKYQSGCDQNGV